MGRGAGRSVIFVVGRADDASVRFRVRQYVPYLRSRGWDPVIVETAVPLVERLRRLRQSAGYDRVVVHRVLLPPLEAALLRASSGGYVFDFDDALMVRDSSRAEQRSWQRRGSLRRMIRGARTVVAGNRHLADWAAPLHSSVHVVPTVLELDEYPAKPPAEIAPPTIGWIGTRTNLLFLRDILPALARALCVRPDARFEVVSDAPLESREVGIVNTRWSPAGEAAALRRFAVGIMPLRDDPWTRGKCGTKILQYFASWLPVVCSPVGTNRELVTEGENGHFAASEDEWVERLTTLVDDAETRRRLGTAGRRRVEGRYTVLGNLDAFLQTLE